MDDIATRAVIIGVNIFVTITIVSLIVIMFFQMGEIYGIVKNTDTSIYNKFDDVYSMYHGKVESGIGLLNALKRQEETKDKFVVIQYEGSDKIREALSEDNDGKEIERQKRESVYLKELMTGKITDKRIKVKYRYEDKYNVTVTESESENGVLIVNFAKIK